LRGALSVWTGRNGAGTKGIVFTSRVETKSPICIPYRNEAFLGIVPGVAGASLGNPGLGYAFPSGMFRPAGWSARENVDHGAV